MNPPARRAFFAIFALSGFSGLIYESIWTHYLKLFLGHAAYAQTLVLAIFMGGMAVGSALAGRRSARIRNLLVAYAVVEGVVGLAALLFHPVFVLAVEGSYSSVLPGLGSPVAVDLYKWGLAALLILPQSLLLGATFPLMTAGVIRRFPLEPGRSVSMLYFTNSLGAAAGVLASGFVMIDALGLPGTVRAAGVLNLIVAVVVWRLAREDGATPGGEEARPQLGRERKLGICHLLPDDKAGRILVHLDDSGFPVQPDDLAVQLLLPHPHHVVHPRALHAVGDHHGARYPLYHTLNHPFTSLSRCCIRWLSAAAVPCSSSDRSPVPLTGWG